MASFLTARMGRRILILARFLTHSSIARGWPTHHITHKSLFVCNHGRFFLIYVPETSPLTMENAGVKGSHCDVFTLYTRTMQLRECWFCDKPSPLLHLIPNSFDDTEDSMPFLVWRKRPIGGVSPFLMSGWHSLTWYGYRYLPNS